MTSDPGDRTPAPGRASLPFRYRLLRLFADVRPGEAAKALLLMSNVFLLLMAYYIMKPLRETLLLVNDDAPAVKSYLSAAQAIAFIFVIKAFSRLSSRVPRHVLITRTTLFFISNLVGFFALNLAGMPRTSMGILFFVWIGVFNWFVIAQFWGFANDLYTEEAGKRIFPLIAFGATLGAVVGNRLGVLRDLLGGSWEYKLMLLAAAVLLACIALAIAIHRREVRRAAAGEGRAAAEPGRAAEAARAQERPLRPGGAFKLVFGNRYLLAIALLVGLMNFINATGEFIITDVQTRASLAEAGTGSADLAKSIHAGFMDYQLLTNLVALGMQLFLVARIFRWLGIGGALFILPLVALFGYGYMTLGVSIVLVRWVKSLENGIDYSLMNTTRAALFLVTTREEKYKAKAATDTFFVRGGDTLAAAAVFLGTGVFSLAIERFAVINTIAVALWLGLSLVILREHRRKAKAPAGLTAAAPAP